MIKLEVAGSENILLTKFLMYLNISEKKFLLLLDLLLHTRYSTLFSHIGNK